MHGQDASGDELAVLADAEVPGLYPHHVVKHELQVQTPLHTHLRSEVRGQRDAGDRKGSPLTLTTSRLRSPCSSSLSVEVSLSVTPHPDCCHPEGVNVF